MPPHPKAKPQPRKNTREYILAAAADLFAGKGFRGTTISDIAGRAGVNRALISYHFGSKAGLYEQLLDQAVTAAAEALDDLRLDPSSDQPERQLIQAFASVYQSQPHLAPMLMREHLDPEFFLDSGHAEKLRGFINLTRKVIAAVPLRERAQDYDVQIVHLICVGALIYFLLTAPYRDRMQTKLKPPPTRPSVDEFAEVLADFVSRGLRD